MEDKNARIFVSAVNSISKKLEMYGDVDLSQVNLLKLIYKYACYSTQYSVLKRLDVMVAELQRTSPYICLEINAVQAYVDSSITVPIIIIGQGENNPPTITGTSVTLDDTTSVYTFTTVNIYNGYTDTELTPAGNFVIKTLPATGTLKYNGINAVVDTLYANPTLLTYTRSGTNGYGDTFSWAVFDTDAQLPLESNTAVMTITVTALVQSNEPATVGDRAQYAGNRAVTIFTVADFTTQTIAPYFDPEANDLDAIRIDEVSTANTGVYYYLGSPVIEGQVITASELADGAFYHIAADANGITTDSFNASVRDTGSMIWVQ